MELKLKQKVRHISGWEGTIVDVTPWPNGVIRTITVDRHNCNCGGEYTPECFVQIEEFSEGNQ